MRGRREQRKIRLIIYRGRGAGRNSGKAQIEPAHMLQIAGIALFRLKQRPMFYICSRKAPERGNLCRTRIQAQFFRIR